MGQKNSRHGSSPTEQVDTTEFEQLYREWKTKEWYDDFAKDCPKFRLTKPQFVELYQQNTNLSENLCEHVFRAFDTNDSGVINFKEFLLAMKVTDKGSPKQKLEWAFRIYDIDGNGTIEETEMIEIIKAMKTMNEPEAKQSTDDASRALAKKIFKKMDVNDNKKVSMKEFVDYWLTNDQFFQFVTDTN